MDNIDGLLSSLDKEEQCATTIFQENFVKFIAKLDETKSHWRTLIKIQFKELSPWLENDSNQESPKGLPSSNTVTTSTSSASIASANFEYFSPLVNEESKISCSNPTCRSTFGHKRCNFKMITIILPTLF